MTNLTPILVMTAAYFLLILIAIVWGRVRKTGSLMPGLDEFFLAGRGLSAPVLILTFIGSTFSAFTVVGMPGSVFANGLGGAGFAMIFCIMFAAFILTFGEAIRNYAREHKLFSPYECVSHAYHSKWLGLVISLVVFVVISPYLSLQLVGLGKLLEGLSGGEIGYLNGVGSIMAVIALYLIFGGMRAVAYTDVVQSIAIYIGIFAGAALFVSLNWDGLSDMFTQAAEKNPEILTLPGPKNFYTPQFFLSYCLFFSGLAFQPHLLTRMMMAKDKMQIKYLAVSIFIAGIISYIPGIIFGVGGSLLYPDLAESNQLLGHIFSSLSASGLFGLLITGLILLGTIGASMSTADSILLSLGQIFTRDVVRPFMIPSHGTQVLIARVVMLLILGAAFWIGLNPPPVMIEMAIYSTIGMGMLSPTILFFRWKRRSLIAAYSSITCSLIALVAMVITHIRPYGFHEGVVTLAVSMSIYILVCLAYNPAKNKA